MNQMSVTVFWTIIAVLLTIAAVIPVNSLDRPGYNSVKREAQQKKDAKTSEKPPAGVHTGQTTPPALPSTLSSNTTHSSQNCTHGRNNVTGECITNSSGPWYNIIGKNKGMLERTMYVLIAITVLVVLYFVIKTIRLRRRKSKTRKYGVLSTSGHDNMEMTPLDQEEEDEDMTVFEVNGHAKK